MCQFLSQNTISFANTVNPIKSQTSIAILLAVFPNAREFFFGGEACYFRPKRKMKHSTHTYTYIYICVPSLLSVAILSLFRLLCFAGCIFGVPFGATNTHKTCVVWFVPISFSLDTLSSSFNFPFVSPLLSFALLFEISSAGCGLTVDAVLKLLSGMPQLELLYTNGIAFCCFKRTPFQLFTG